MLVVGARPNFVKIAPIVRALESEGRLEPWLVHTGQHYDKGMSDVFFNDLGLPPPRTNLGVGSASQAEQTGAVMVALETLVDSVQPAIIVTVGDVTSTLAAALVAAKACIPQAHVEAGLRSGDPTMPEEVNRVVTDRLADILFTHSEEANENLLREGTTPDRIQFVGNVMIDSLVRLRPRWKGAARQAIPDLPSAYGVVTLHRPSNVDDDASLQGLMQALNRIAQRLPLLFPVHPRTRKRLTAGVNGKVRLLEPLGYLAFLDLLEHARLVLTDSGGIQEETTVLGVPCLTVRENTERQVTVRLGTNRVVGADPEAIVSAALAVLASPLPAAAMPPLWDGHAAERIAPILANWVSEDKGLRLQS
jgi:UDP-N-acetylglucosamine 2-epimerase (non-hydrolysing)